MNDRETFKPISIIVTQSTQVFLDADLTIFQLFGQDKCLSQIEEKDNLIFLFIISCQRFFSKENKYNHGP